ncbi:MAG TPA: hypothetical protein VF944_04520 [Candidatus Bathyarchaeia archaeon]
MSNALDKQLDTFAENISRELDDAHDETAQAQPDSVMDLRALGEAYASELKQLRSIRRDFIFKKSQIKKSIMIIEKRIAVNLSALRTLGLPLAVDDE